ncbi:MAG: hypothetical protein ABIM44_05725 [candidate division WOR-3 bacterium]
MIKLFTTYGSVESIKNELKTLFSTTPCTIIDFKIRPITYDERTLNLTATVIYDDNGTTQYRVEFFYGAITETLAQINYFLNHVNSIHFFEQFPFVFHKKNLFLFTCFIYT